MPPGPYLVVPFLGPSTVRDAPSIYVDVQTDLRIGDYLDTTTEWALVGISFVNRRAELLAFDSSYENAYDQYAFIRNAWLQRREYQVKDGDVADDIPLDEFEELEDPAGPEVPEVPEGAPAGDEPAATQPPVEDGPSSSATSLIPASEASRGRNVPVAEPPPRGTGRERPFEQQRKSRAVHPRDACEVHFGPLEAGESGVALGEQARRVGRSRRLRRARSGPDPPPPARRASTRRQRPGAGAPTWFSFSSRSISASSPVWSTSVPTSFLKLRT